MNTTDFKPPQGLKHFLHCFCVLFLLKPVIILRTVIVILGIISMYYMTIMQIYMASGTVVFVYNYSYYKVIAWIEKPLEPASICST